MDTRHPDLARLRLDGDERTVDEQTVRAMIARDLTLGGEIPADASITGVHELDLAEAVRLSTEYPKSFQRHKGTALHAATISYVDPATGFWRSRVVIMASDGTILMVT